MAIFTEFFLIIFFILVNKILSSLLIELCLLIEPVGYLFHLDLIVLESLNALLLLIVALVVTFY